MTPAFLPIPSTFPADAYSKEQIDFLLSEHAAGRDIEHLLAMDPWLLRPEREAQILR